MEMDQDSSSSPDSPDPPNIDLPTCDIPILLDGTVRWVTGLTKRTTCDDVIYALLYHDGTHEGESTENYAIFERWRDVERPLQSRTKIVKIWRAWGNEQCNVELSVRKLKDYNYISGESYRRRRHKRSKHRSRHHNDCGCRPGTHKNCYQSGKLRSLESLVKLVIAQERKLHELNDRIEKTDDKIDNLETRRHFSRVKQNGDNYVQSAYLDSLSEDSMDELFGNVRTENIEEYIDFCEKIIKLEENLSDEHSKLKDLSKLLQEALAKSDCIGTGLSSLNDHDLPLGQQLEQVQVEMNRLVSAGMMLRYQDESVRRELVQCDKHLEVKRQLIRSLRYDLDTMHDSSHAADDSQDVSTDDSDDRVSVIQIYESPPKTRNKSVTFDDRLNHMHVIGTSHENLTDNYRFTDRTGSSSIKPHLYMNERHYRRQPDYPPPQHKITSILKNKEQYNCSTTPYPVNTQSGSDQAASFQSDSSADLDRLTSAHDSGRYHLPSGMYTFAKDGHFSLLDSSSKEYKDEDSNSDTGLSSMHSDESPGLETLV